MKRRYLDIESEDCDLPNTTGFLRALHLFRRVVDTLHVARETEAVFSSRFFSRESAMKSVVSNSLHYSFSAVPFPSIHVRSFDSSCYQSDYQNEQKEMNSMESNKQLCLVGVINNFLNAKIQNSNKFIKLYFSQQIID